RLQLATLIEVTGRRGGLLLAGRFVLLVALLLTGSRGGVIATACGLRVLAGLVLRPRRPRPHRRLAPIAPGGPAAVAALVAFGDPFVTGLVERGIGDAGRMAVYLITLGSILDAPLQGHGYGTFADVFPMYRDRSIPVQGAWLQAHDTYLEVFQGL